MGYCRLVFCMGLVKRRSPAVQTLAKCNFSLNIADGANEYPSLGAASKLAMSTGRNVASNGAIPKWRSGNKGGLTNPDFLNQHFPSLGGEGGGGPPGSSGTAPAKPGPVHTVNYQVWSLIH